MNPKLVLFSDLDGTILDESYNYELLKPIINKIKSNNVAIVIVSSKSQMEVEYFREKFDLSDPYVVENGSAIFIPRNYFNSKYASNRITQEYRIIELGVNYKTIRDKIALIQKRYNIKIVGFGDLTAIQVAKETSLPLELAQLAKKRDYDEPFKIIHGTESEVLRAISEQGLKCIKGGKYLHAMGNTDKGKAVRILKDLYLQQYANIVTIGVGNDENDVPMLKAVNKPFKIENNKMLIAWQEISEMCNHNNFREH